MKPEQRVGAVALLVGMVLFDAGAALIWPPLGVLFCGLQLAVFGGGVLRGIR